MEGLCWSFHPGMLILQTSEAGHLPLTPPEACHAVGNQQVVSQHAMCVSSSSRYLRLLKGVYGALVILNGFITECMLNCSMRDAPEDLPTTRHYTMTMSILSKWYIATHLLDTSSSCSSCCPISLME